MKNILSGCTRMQLVQLHVKHDSQDNLSVRKITVSFLVTCAKMFPFLLPTLSTHTSVWDKTKEFPDISSFVTQPWILNCQNNLFTIRKLGRLHGLIITFPLECDGSWNKATCFVVLSPKMRSYIFKYNLIHEIQLNVFTLDVINWI